jgi:hypothetical protein
MDFFLNSLGSMVGLIEMKYALGWLRYILEIFLLFENKILRNSS